MSKDDIIKDVRRRMDGAIDALKHELAGLRTGRASTNMLEPVRVDAYGSEMTVSQVATISVPEPRMLSVQVWDQSLAKAVDRAIRDSGLGLNPIAEGAVIRVPIPELTEDRRREMGKVAARYGEQARISVRNVRRDGLDKLKKLEKDSEISQDELRGASDRVQAVTDERIKQIDDLVSAKEKEIMQV
ncbi:ribosome-recycling factor [Tistrella bauzanensis]|uniref:Ribosome-recycling factor n=2 Tax=Tistrella bauzanensis TaxID=657419 RepID=A0ABQ1IAS3_9PROT|nr:ribosome-recycling factor [Tistrella bauzanensis]